MQVTLSLSLFSFILLTINTISPHINEHWTLHMQRSLFTDSSFVMFFFTSLFKLLSSLNPRPTNSDSNSQSWSFLFLLFFNLNEKVPTKFYLTLWHFASISLIWVFYLGGGPWKNRLILLFPYLFESHHVIVMDQTICSLVFVRILANNENELFHNGRVAGSFARAKGPSRRADNTTGPP